MKNLLKKPLFFTLLLLFIIFISNTPQIFAQNNGVEMADIMRSNGKIYVVVATLGLVLAGIIFYLIRIDLQIKKMEKEN